MRAVFIFGIFLAGCSAMDLRSTDPAEIAPAKTTGDGRVIVHEWVTTEGGRKAHEAILGGKYGLMVFWDERSKKPPRFEFFMADPPQVIRTTSLARLKEGLGRISRGERLHYYNTCGGGTHSGLDPAVIEEIKAECARRGIQFQEGDDKLYIICTCP